MPLSRSLSPTPPLLILALLLISSVLMGCPEPSQHTRAEEGVGGVEGERPLAEQPLSDPEAVRIETLETRYTKDIQGEGALYAIIETSHGEIPCRLWEDEVPHTVDNFVGLARGLKPWREMRTGDWKEAPFYDGLSFYRVVPDVLIQSGDPTGRGDGHPGYEIDDEFYEGLAFDQAGVLAMAQAHPNGSGSQFFITDGATPQFNDRYPIFGLCEGLETVHQIASTDTQGDLLYRPAEPPTIKAIRFERRASAAHDAEAP